MYKTLLRNVTSNWAGFAVQAVVTFFLTPFVVASLGEVRYGVWALIVGVTGYYGLLDLGCRAGMAQYMTRHMAARDFAKLNETASTGFAALATCSVILLPATLLLAAFAPRWFDMPATAVRETQICLLVIGASVALQFLWYPFSTVFTVTQRFDLANAVGICSTLCIATATYLALRAGFGLISLSLITVAGNHASYAVRWRLAYRILPQLKISLSVANYRSLGAIVTFGAWSFLVAAARGLKYNANAVIVGLTMPIAAIGAFALAQGLVQHFERLFVPIGNVFFPAMTDLDARGERQQLRNVYMHGSRILLLLASAAGIIAFAWAGEFYALWLGTRSGAYQDAESIAGVFCVLISGSIFVAGQSIGNQVFYATRRLKTLGQLTAIEGLTSFTAACLLAEPFGLAGVACAVAGAAVAFQGCVHPVLVCRLLEIPLSEFVRTTYVRPIVVAALCGGAVALLKAALPTAASWSELAWQGALAGGAAVGLIASIGLTRQERRRFLLSPLADAIERVGRAWTPRNSHELAKQFEDPNRSLLK